MNSYSISLSYLLRFFNLIFDFSNCENVDTSFLYTVKEESVTELFRYSTIASHPASALHDSPLFSRSPRISPDNRQTYLLPSYQYRDFQELTYEVQHYICYHLF